MGLHHGFDGLVDCSSVFFRNFHRYRIVEGYVYMSSHSGFLTQTLDPHA